MKLRNKKTGEIAIVEGFGSTESEIQMTYTIDNDETELYLYCTSSLTTFNEEWEDYEEPKDHYYIDFDGDIMIVEALDYEPKIKTMKEIGNYFETKEEAEKAVEKLKAWKRLKDRGFEFECWTYKIDEPKIENHTHFKIVGVCEDGVRFDDLDLLFGGEE